MEARYEKKTHGPSPLKKTLSPNGESCTPPQWPYGHARRLSYLNKRRKQYALLPPSVGLAQ